MSAADAFEPVRAALEGAGIRYAIGGSWASTAFGEPRLTNDIDILAFTTGSSICATIGCFRDPTYSRPRRALPDHHARLDRASRLTEG
jgi:hypothetical protein